MDLEQEVERKLMESAEFPGGTMARPAEEQGELDRIWQALRRPCRVCGGVGETSRGLVCPSCDGRGSTPPSSQRR